MMKASRTTGGARATHAVGQMHRHVTTSTAHAARQRSTLLTSSSARAPRCFMSTAGDCGGAKVACEARTVRIKRAAAQRTSQSCGVSEQSAAPLLVAAVDVLCACPRRVTRGMHRRERARRSEASLDALRSNLHEERQKQRSHGTTPTSAKGYVQKRQLACDVLQVAACKVPSCPAAEVGAAKAEISVPSSLPLSLSSPPPELNA
jgi:hypothetical protein